MNGSTIFPSVSFGMHSCPKTDILMLLYAISIVSFICFAYIVPVDITIPIIKPKITFFVVKHSFLLTYLVIIVHMQRHKKCL